MINKIALVCISLAAFEAAHALDISGRVVDKRFAPIPGAQICVSGGTACASSGTDGTFHLTGTSSLFRSDARLSRDYSFAFARGVAALNAPEAAHARLEWFDARGARLGAAQEIDLVAGRNALALPAPSGRGPLMLRLTTDRFSVTWRAVLEGTSGASAASFAAAAKTAAPAGLDVTKSGFANAVYLPKAETETNDIIVMGGTGENVKLLFDGKTLEGWSPFTKNATAPNTWDVQDSALHCKGTTRGTLNTDADYGSYRVIFSVKHIHGAGGNDHQPCVLVFCYRTPLYDAAGGVQFQVPNGGHWDYRPGKNTGNPGNEFTTPGGALKLTNTDWNQCEIITDKAAGTAKMACCALTGNGPCKGVPNLNFHDATAGRDGPFALQAHNGGLYDEYKNISIELNPTDKDFATAK